MAEGISVLRLACVFRATDSQHPDFLGDRHTGKNLPDDAELSHRARIPDA